MGSEFRSPSVWAQCHASRLCSGEKTRYVSMRRWPSAPCSAPGLTTPEPAHDCFCHLSVLCRHFDIDKHAQHFRPHLVSEGFQVRGPEVRVVAPPRYQACLTPWPMLKPQAYPKSPGLGCSLRIMIKWNPASHRRRQKLSPSPVIKVCSLQST